MITIEAELEARVVTEQVIELRCERNVLPKHFPLHPFARPQWHHRNGIHLKTFQNGDKAEPSLPYRPLWKAYSCSIKAPQRWHRKERSHREYRRLWVN